MEAVITSGLETQTHMKERPGEMMTHNTTERSEATVVKSMSDHDENVMVEQRGRC